jgi:hypothetical protein
MTPIPMPAPPATNEIRSTLSELTVRTLVQSSDSAPCCLFFSLTRQAIRYRLRASLLLGLWRGRALLGLWVCLLRLLI